MPNPSRSRPAPSPSDTTALPSHRVLDAEVDGTHGARPMAAVQCARCGEEWPTGDPALRVACPSCQAPPGRRCRRPSAHECAVHAARDRLAMDRGLLKPCPALTWDDRHAKPLPWPARPAPPRLACTAPIPAQGVLL